MFTLLSNYLIVFYIYFVGIRQGQTQRYPCDCYVEQEFGVSYSLTNICRLLHQLDFSWITSRSKHPKQSQDAQEDFKKIQN